MSSFEARLCDGRHFHSIDECLESKEGAKRIHYRQDNIIKQLSRQTRRTGRGKEPATKKNVLPASCLPQRQASLRAILGVVLVYTRNPHASS